MDKKRILVTCPRVDTNIDDFKRLFEKKGFDYKFSYPENQQHNSLEINELLNNISIAIVGDDEINQNVLNSSAGLNCIIKWGSGTDNIDKKSAEINGIQIFNTPNILGKYVAEYGLGLLLSLIKQITKTDREVRKNNWYKNENFTLYNSKIGFFGFGDVASEFAKLLTPFSTTITYCDIQEKECSFEKLSFERLLEHNDIIVVTSNLTDQNKNIFDKNAFKKMGQNSYLVNISRGGLINEKDLQQALVNYEIRGAALDVFASEPLAKNNQFKSLGNVLLGTHNASNVLRANIEVNEYILKLMEKIL